MRMHRLLGERATAAGVGSARAGGGGYIDLSHAGDQNRPEPVGAGQH